MAPNSTVRACIAVGAVLLGAATVAWVAPRGDSTRVRPSDFESELVSLDREIAALGGHAVPQIEAQLAKRLAQRLYQRAALTEREDHFHAVRRVLDNLHDRDAREPGVALLDASLQLRFHRLGAARAALQRSPDLAGSSEAQMIAADIDLQMGRYDAAERSYRAVVARDPSWRSLARLAFLTGLRGDAHAADRLYEKAADDVTAKEMRAYAWLQLQRGQLHFTRGRYDQARVHYDLAERAYSGFWLVDEYAAELLAAERRFGEAITRYTRAIARAPRPDLLQQLGDVYVFAGKPDEAKRWHARAREGYQASIDRGEVQVLHHLAGFYADVERDGPRAVKHAREDVELRPGYASLDALAWALYVDGNLPESVAYADRALASGIVDGHLYYHAATIKGAAGDEAGARRLFAALETLNPRYRDFHVHR
jgi:tetratricopeptide (TPR) repeat protein